MDWKNVKKILGIAAAAFGTAFVLTYIAGKKKQGESRYENDPEQKNPMEGKKVIFIEDENDKENADGLKGHLEAVGESDHKAGVYEKYIKRGVDIVLSFGGLVVLSPVLLGIAVAIKIDDPGPVLFTQKRVGENKKYFKLHKFRSMKMSTPHDKPTHMLENPEQYITRVGKFIRAHSLDELPQIWDIFIGNMSVIGPRPGLWNQDFLTAERDKYGANDIKPGLTGWAQINGRDEIEIPVKAKLDGEYAQKMGLIMDAKVFLGSLHVFSGDDSLVEGGTGEMKRQSVGCHYTDGKSSDVLIGHIGFGEPVEIDTEIEKKVLITGAGSYIGETFRAYANEHYPALKVDAVDMLDPAWREKEFSTYDVIYHVAGIAHADIGNLDDATKAKYYAVNTDLAVEVCEKAKAEGVKEFVFMSSMIVYGDSAPFGKSKIVDENTVPVATNFYGDSKLQADVAVRALADESFKVIVLRPPMIYGKGSKGNYQTLAKLAKNLPVFPNVDNERSMLHIDNLCELLCQIMMVKEVKENAVVLTPQNGEWTKTSNMVKEIGEVAGKKVRLIGGIMKLAVLLGGKVPGRIGGLVNKAFGNSVYVHEMSIYEGINYQITTLKESIQKTEGFSMNSNIKKLENLKGKKVLLIALPGYPDGIVKKMKELGAEVDYIHDKPNEGFVTKTLGRLQLGFYQKVLESYYENVLFPLKERDYDYVLAIRGEYTPINSLKIMREYYPNAKLVLYMWDGLHKQNTMGIEKKWPFYDQVYTFDRIDYEANKDKLRFLPLYYYEEYLPTDIKSANDEGLEYDISFIGTAHDDRINVVKSIMQQGAANGLSCFSYFFMPHKLVYLKNKLINKEFKNVTEADICYQMMPLEKLYQTYANSRCVVDVENKGQHGLTMRSIEIIGLRRKFITTNQDIKNYDFYNANNILVIDRNNPKLAMDFFERPYEELDEELYKKYSIKNWILEVLK